MLYTVAQAFGTALDAANGNRARKNAGTLFEKLMISVFNEIGIGNSRATLRIPLLIDPVTVQALQEVSPTSTDVIDSEATMITMPQVNVDLEHGQLMFAPEIDTIISPYEQVPLNRDNVDSREVLVSIKTTSKDRMAKIFFDRYILSRSIGRESALGK